MATGADVPGRIVRVPGGVALNIALGLSALGLTPQLLSVVGRDPEGDALLAEVAARGVGTALVHRSGDLPTDRYMAIEAGGRLVAAIADAHSLEAAGEAILAPLLDGRLGRPDAPFDGVAALDGNLSSALLEAVATGPWLSRADLRVVPASPGKAHRLAPLLMRPGTTIYINLEEAGILLGAPCPDAPAAAAALRERGAARVVVTDGAGLAAEGGPGGILTARPPEVIVARVTGAGDAFMAGHIAAELGGADPQDALTAALAAAARHVAGDLTT